ncbi:hypothetical protein [Hymenobacter sp. HDW8]|uniref:hypothetical protein n=1 Tax=Hymenobacter sp. HDW8 TaxID=2714932 RepID=UPI00140749E3|nr:hypothetical protein [Hymenobacter sp. HDW8]QIL76612.1 hypothetical protein G7064_12640 [Hymenobacter sp. HDW8]
MVPEKLTDLLHTNYRSDLNMFVGRWGYQPATELLPRAYELLKDNALANGCRFWLQDIRRRTFNDPVITNWLLTEYFPQMSAQLGGRLRVAYLTGPDLLAAIRSMPNFLPPSAYDDKPYVVAFFSTESDAMQWLQQEQIRELVVSKN